MSLAPGRRRWGRGRSGRASAPLRLPRGGPWRQRGRRLRWQFFGGVGKEEGERSGVGERGGGEVRVCGGRVSRLKRRGGEDHGAGGAQSSGTAARARALSRARKTTNRERVRWTGLGRSRAGEERKEVGRRGVLGWVGPVRVLGLFFFFLLCFLFYVFSPFSNCFEFKI